MIVAIGVLSGNLIFEIAVRTIESNNIFMVYIFIYFLQAFELAQFIFRLKLLYIQVKNIERFLNIVVT